MPPSTLQYLLALQILDQQFTSFIIVVALTIAFDRYTPSVRICHDKIYEETTCRIFRLVNRPGIAGDSVL